jgi:multiple sugar transport system substrate-binding protein
VDFMGEFAAPGWLADVSSLVGSRQAAFIASTLTTARYRHRYFGVPASTDAGLLYYRTDRIAAVPDTWQAVYDSARAKGGIVYQGGAYEGLTCDWLEISRAAGGELLSPDGRRSVIDSPANLRALELMVNGLRTGATPTIVATFFDEFASHSAFFTGGPAYMRNWPYAWGLGQGTNFAGKFDVAMLPKFAGAGRGGVLGGLDLAVSRYAHNPRGAVLAIDYLTSPEAQRLGADPQVSMWPVLKATWEEPAVKANAPFAALLEQQIELSRSRPVTPKYHDISAAVYDNVHAALHGDASPADALRAADEQIDQILRGN